MLSITNHSRSHCNTCLYDYIILYIIYVKSRGPNSSETEDGTRTGFRLRVTTSAQALGPKATGHTKHSNKFKGQSWNSQLLYFYVAFGLLWKDLWKKDTRRLALDDKISVKLLRPFKSTPSSSTLQTGNLPVRNSPSVVRHGNSFKQNLGVGLRKLFALWATCTPMLSTICHPGLSLKCLACCIRPFVLRSFFSTR